MMPAPHRRCLMGPASGPPIIPSSPVLANRTSCRMNLNDAAEAVAQMEKSPRASQRTTPRGATATLPAQPAPVPPGPMIEKRRILEEERNSLLDTDDEADKVPTSGSSNLLLENENQPLLYAANFDYNLFWTTLLRRYPPDSSADRWEQIAAAYDEEVKFAQATATKNFTESLGRVNDEPRVQPLLMAMSKEGAVERARQLHEELGEAAVLRRKGKSVEWKLCFLRLLLQGSTFAQAKATSVRFRQETRPVGCGTDLCYGELDPYYFYRLLKRLRLVHGQLQFPDELVFYDLGCGRGVMLFVAALAFNFHKVIGLEAVEPFKEEFERLKKKWDDAVLPRLGHAKLIERKRAVAIKFRVADVLEDMQWANTGGVFLLHASGMGPETMRGIEVKMATRLPRGCLVITVGRPLSSDAWLLLGKDKGVATSYGPATVYCYEKDREPPPRPSAKPASPPPPES